MRMRGRARLGRPREQRSGHAVGRRGYTSAPMRVLHVAQPEHSGVPAVVAAMVRDQLSSGLEAAVACPAASILRRELDGTGARLLPWEATRSPGPTSAGEIARLSGVLRRVAPDLVHLHAAKAGLAGRAALRGRRPTIYQPHAWSFEAVEGPLRPLVVGWERLAARWADRILCVSEDELRHGRSAGVRGRYVAIPNGVDLERFTPASADEKQAARRELDLPDGPLAVCVARLSRQKGVDVLLHAWASVTAPGATLVVVGDGPDREPLAARSPPGVIWAGERRDVPRWLAAAQVVVLPSRWEGAPLVVLEAMARARSVVSTDVGGTRGLLAGGAGEVVPVEDPAALAAALQRRLADHRLARREGTEGRRRVEERYDLRAINRQVMDMYLTVLADR
jgi:glycosyltransferase involved in cell wall biosynthesis